MLSFLILHHASKGTRFVRHYEMYSFDAKYTEKVLEIQNFYLFFLLFF
jgi:hypothetical protein